MILFDILKKIFITELVLHPPIKSKILIYDNASILNGTADVLFKRVKKSIYYNRFEKINLYILLKAFFFRKYSTLRDNYKYHYIKHVEPIIVYTAIDNNPSFYLLKNLYPHATYISDQESMRNNSFANTCKQLIKTKRLKLRCDYLFVFGDYEKKRIKRFINAKVIALGNTKNNFFNSKNKEKKEKRIVYISSKIRMRPIFEKKIFQNLLIFFKKFNYKLIFLDRDTVKGSRIFMNNKSYLEKIFGKKNWNYLQIKDLKKKHKYLRKSQLITYMHSTLGFQCLSTGLKTFSFNYNKYDYSGDQKIKDFGPFWCKPENYNLVERKLLSVINFKKSYWTKIINKFSKNVLVYKKNNKEKLAIIKHILKKNI